MCCRETSSEDQLSRLGNFRNTDACFSVLGESLSDRRHFALVLTIPSSDPSKAVGLVATCRYRAIASTT